jgi:hypothetical protein
MIQSWITRTCADDSVMSHSSPHSFYFIHLYRHDLTLADVRFLEESCHASDHAGLAVRDVPYAALDF